MSLRMRGDRRRTPSRPPKLTGSAGVSKLAAEMDSKSIAGNRVRVRVPPPARPSR